MKSFSENHGGLKEQLEAELLKESQKPAEEMNIALIDSITELLEHFDPKMCENAEPTQALQKFRQKAGLERRNKKRSVYRAAVALIAAILFLLSINMQTEANVNQNIFEFIYSASQRIFNIHASGLKVKDTTEYDDWKTLRSHLPYSIFVPNNIPDQYQQTGLSNTTYTNGSQLITANYQVRDGVSEKYLRLLIHTYYADGTLIEQELLDWDLSKKERYQGIVTEYYTHDSNRESESLNKCTFTYQNTIYVLEADMELKEFEQLVKNMISGG